MSIGGAIRSDECYLPRVKFISIPVNPKRSGTLNSHDSRMGVKAIEVVEKDLMHCSTGKDDE
jgi:hypothetical protein